MFDRFYTKQNVSVTVRLPRLRRIRISRGQTMVEFAMVSVLFLVVMMVGVQFAMIGQAALALSQGASAIARYAAVNESTLGFELFGYTERGDAKSAVLNTQHQ